MTLAAIARPLQSGFFRHHGAWAIGVRLFRNLNFAAKAGLISLTFGIPLTVLMWAYLSTGQAVIRTAQHERAGVALLHQIEPWITQVQKERRQVMAGEKAAPDLDALAARMNAVGTAAGTYPEGLDINDVVAKARTLHQALSAATAATLPEQLQAYADGVLDLRAVTLDRSSLTLDPDQDTYYLMALATDAVGGAAEALSRSRAQAMRVPADNGVAQARALRQLYALRAEAEHHASTIVNHAAHAIEGDASLSKALNIEPMTAAMAQFVKTTDATWFADAFTPGGEPVRAGGQQAVDALRTLQGDALKLLDERLQRRIDRTLQARYMVLAVTVAALAAAAYLFYAFALVMRGGLAEVARHLQAMTDGDLTTSPSPWGRDEAAELMLLLRQMQDSLRTMVGQVRASVDNIVQASTEISAGAHDLSSRTEQAAANLQKSASAMEQIGGTVRQTADHAGEATRIATENARSATRGGEVMERMLQTMDGIQASSRQIGEIIGTVDGIAFQTNILALNAAVEAARAGEAGRGFAVVASEVRTLAQRSADAARQIKTLVGRSVEQVDSGTHVARDAGQTMGALLQDANRIDGLLNEIAHGTREQSQGVAEVGGSMQSLDAATQQNAALVEQTAAAASSLRDQAGLLAEQVARFRMPA